MSLRRVVLVIALVIYVGLWAIAIDGASGLVAPLAVPAVLAVMVWLGLQLERYLGLKPRGPKFHEREDESRP
ncbi:MAG: hypothetical protein ACRDV0_04750 [Acidimicrobiales bacterium]